METTLKCYARMHQTMMQCRYACRNSTREKKLYNPCLVNGELWLICAGLSLLSNWIIVIFNNK